MFYVCASANDERAQTALRLLVAGAFFLSVPQPRRRTTAVNMNVVLRILRTKPCLSNRGRPMNARWPKKVFCFVRQPRL